MNCILRKAAENEKQVTYLFFPKNTGVPNEPGKLRIDKIKKAGRLLKKPKADEGCEVSLYTGLAFAVAYRFMDEGNYPETGEGAW